MTEAHQAAEGGASHGTIIVADRQSQGRGQHGRCWNSPDGNLYTSIILRPPPRSHTTFPQGLPLVAGIAIAQALEKIGVSAIQLKWPNDLISRHGKIAGLLIESRWLASELQHLVLGIGVNVSVRPVLTDQNPMAREPRLIADVVTPVPNLIAICRELYMNFEACYLNYLTCGLLHVVDQWNSRDYLSGKTIRIWHSGSVIEGVANGITTEGWLRVRASTGVVLVQEATLELIDPTQHVKEDGAPPQR